MNKVFTYESLAHAISGALGGSISMAALYPLDQVRSIQQVEGITKVSTKNKKYGTLIGTIIDLLNERGWGALYKGHLSMQVALGASNFVYFYCYNGLKTAVTAARAKSRQAVLSSLENLSIATISGILNVFITSPFWVINMRLKADQSSKYSGICDCFFKMIQQEGVQSLWNGTVASLILVSNPVIHFFTYEWMKTQLLNRRIKALGKKASLSGIEYFLMGALAKAIATVITYPLQVAQAKMRIADAKKKSSSKGGNVESSPSKGVIQYLAEIHKKSGTQGLYAGMEAKLAQTVLTAALTLLTYEQIVQMVFTLMYYKKYAHK